MRLHAVLESPIGSTAAFIQIWGDDPTTTYQVHAVHSPTGTPTLLGGGKLDALVGLSPYTSSHTDYLLVTVDVQTPNQRIYGGIVYEPAQGVVLYSQQFGTSQSISLDPPMGGVGWDVDATPDTPAEGLPFTSPSASLNFNDGTDYASTVGPVSGNATTVAINLSGSTTPELSFKSRWDIGGTAGNDQRIVQISKDGFSSLLVDQVLPADGGEVWLTETLLLNPAWGTVQVRFRFVSDGLDDLRPGWYVDDMVVSEQETGPGSVVARLTPRQFLLSKQ